MLARNKIWLKYILSFQRQYLFNLLHTHQTVNNQK
jgi:hypothetical protein